MNGSSPAEMEWIHWASGILTACLIIPIWASWVSDDSIRLGQKVLFLPLCIGFLGGVGFLIGAAASGEEWGASSIGLALATGIALLVTIVKSIRGTFGTKEDMEED